MNGPLAISIAALSISCNQVGENPELITTVTTLGSIPSPVAIEAPPEGQEQFAHATFYVAIPKEIGGAIGRPFVDKNFPDGIKGKMSLVAGTAEEAGEFRILKLEAKAAIPSKKLIMDQFGPGDHLFRFGMNMFSLKGPRDRIINEFWVTEDSYSAKLDWVNPDLVISEPSMDQAIPLGTAVSLLTDLSAPNAEEIRVSWHVTSGKVENRRAANTTWTNLQPGVQAAFITVTGQKSGACAMKYVRVNVE